MKTIDIEVMNGDRGLSLYVNGRRVAGCVYVDRSGAAIKVTVMHAPDEPQDGWGPKPLTVTNCIVCTRIVDTREKHEGGDPFGCERDEGWVCSSECYDKIRKKK